MPRATGRLLRCRGCGQGVPEVGRSIDDPMLGWRWGRKGRQMCPNCGRADLEAPSFWQGQPFAYRKHKGSIILVQRLAPLEQRRQTIYTSRGKQPPLTFVTQVPQRPRLKRKARWRRA
jgi:hypothetical protein